MERTIANQVKNLQVSISIAHKDTKDILSALNDPKMTKDDKQRKIVRLAQLEKIISEKTVKLNELKAKLPKGSRSNSKVTVTDEDINNIVKKHKIVI